MSSSKDDEATSQFNLKGTTSSDSKTPQLKDPLEVLPEELLSHLLFPLSPFSIAASSAVCRAWREAILSDSTLHTEIDLSKVEWRRQVMDHFIRLSSRSRNRLTKVSLDLSSFWQDHGYEFYDEDDDDDEEEKNFTSATLESLIERLQLSNGTLRDISLILRDEEEDFGEPVASQDALPFLTLLLQPLFEDFSSLKKISVEAPTYIAIKAGKDEDGSKYFGLEDTSWSGEKSGWTEDAGYGGKININQSRFGPARLELMKLAVNFAGSGLTEFGGGRWVWGSESRQILGKLWASTSTLEVIDLQGFDFLDKSLRKEVWNKATKCSKLVRFNLTGPSERMYDDYYDEFHDSGDELIVESFMITKKSTDLDMNIKSFNMKWEQIAGLVKDLEKFSIDFEGSLRRGLGLFSSGAFEKIILDFKGTLKTLELSGINCGSDTGPDLQVTLLFPNLETLNLFNVQYIVMSLFSRIKSPKLQNVSFRSERLPGDAFASLLSILKEHDTQLIEVACGSNRNGVAKSKKEVFSFPKLERLSIYGGDQSLVDFFSKFDYPNLTQIYPATLKKRFEKSAPKLNQESDGNELQDSEVQSEG